MGIIKETVSRDIQEQKSGGIVEKSEYDQALEKYNLNITDEEVKAAVKKIIAEKVSFIIPMLFIYICYFDIYFFVRAFALLFTMLLLYGFSYEPK